MGFDNQVDNEPPDLERCPGCKRDFRGMQHRHQCPHCGYWWLEEYLLTQNKRLEAIVDKLPKTADGVVVGPGTSTYGPDHSGDIKEWKWGVMPWYDTEQLQELFRDTYSTKEAAEKAREKSDE